MSFSSIERKAITEFRDKVPNVQDWEQSAAEYLRPVAPSTKGLFARQLIERLATEAGVPFASLPGRAGNRRRVGKAICEIKFSMESPARFQQVRPPSTGYDYLAGICVQPASFRYWLIPATDVIRFFANDQITFQHSDGSRWFRAEPAKDDAFSGFRSAQKGFVEALARLA